MTSTLKHSSSSPELILPAGSLEKLHYAIAFGADAVYAGAPLFSLRARENAFNKKSLPAGIDYAHVRGRKVYLTMNIFAHNSRLDRFLDAFEEMYDWGPDGFIVTDPGLLRAMHRRRPDAKLHLSTQANTTNWMSVEFWRDQGVRRVVLARELSLKEIDEIHRRVPDIELECFVHGAMCMAYSGRCMISNYLNHRDANAGACTNACRWEYSLSVQNGSLLSNSSEESSCRSRINEDTTTYQLHEKFRSQAADGENSSFEVDEDEFGTYFMNSKDLCAIELLGDIFKCGVTSFKVEGRSKTIYYLAVVARAYRAAIKAMLRGEPFDPNLIAEIATLSSRTYTTGFFTKRPGSYGENYEDGYSAPYSHIYSGQVLEHDTPRGLAWILVKNKVTQGDLIEWMTPTRTHHSSVITLLDEKMQPIESASGGRRVAVNYEFAPEQFSLMRSRLAKQSLLQSNPDQPLTC